MAVYMQGQLVLLHQEHPYVFAFGETRKKCCHFFYKSHFSHLKIILWLGRSVNSKKIRISLVKTLVLPKSFHV